MKKSYLLTGTLVAVFAVASAGFVLPHGISVIRHEKNFSNQKAEILRLHAAFGSMFSTEDFCLELDNAQGAIENLPALYSRREILAEKENSLRSVWRKLRIETGDLNEHKNNLHDLVVALPSDIDSLLQRITKARGLELRSASSVTDIQTAAENLKADLEGVQSCMVSFAGFLQQERIRVSLSIPEGIEQNVLARNQNVIYETLNVGLESFGAVVREYTGTSSGALETSPDVQQLVTSARSQLVWLAEARSTLVYLCNLGGTQRSCKAKDRIVEKAMNDTRSDIKIVSKVLAAQEESSKRMRAALRTADEANQTLNRLERFARSSEIASVHQSWKSAANRARGARRALNIPAKTKHQQLIVANLTESAATNVNEVVIRIEQHEEFVRAQYLEARREEQSFAGSASRATRRAGDRLGKLLSKKVGQASQSRIGRELAISAKTLILGTKAFYDLMDPNADPLTWAQSYQGDVDRLMQETDEVMQMDGPSLSGKNTFIESMVNQAYDESFGDSN